MELKDVAQMAFEAALKGGLSWQNLAAVGVLVALVAGARLYLAPKIPFFGTSEGGVVLNVAVAGVVGAVTALCAGVPFTWALLGTSLVMSWKAAGGWSLLKNLWPLISSLPIFLKLFPAKGDVVAPVAVVPVASSPSDEIANRP
jgi:hypothetical protein